MKDKILKIILIISSLPFIGLLLIGIHSMIFGYQWFYGKIDGIDGFLSSIVLLVWFLWPLLLVCLAYQIFYLTRHFIKKHKSKNIVADGNSELQDKN